MSLIEQAAQRLEQLRQAGVDVPSPPPAEVVAEPKLEQAPPKARPKKPQPPVKREEPESLESPEMALSRRVVLDLDALTAAIFCTTPSAAARMDKSPFALTISIPLCPACP
jgi:hypothetical protein